MQKKINCIDLLAICAFGVYPSLPSPYHKRYTMYIYLFTGWWVSLYRVTTLWLYVYEKSRLLLTIDKWMSTDWGLISLIFSKCFSHCCRENRLFIGTIYWCVAGVHLLWQFMIEQEEKLCSISVCFVNRSIFRGDYTAHHR